jgi:hypothetical protein
MLGNDQRPILRRAEAASSALDKAAANPDNPFEMIRARREAETVVAELTKVANDDRALSLIKASYGEPKGLFESSPGAAPRFTQSSNVGNSLPGGRPPVAPSAGSVGSPSSSYPQSSNYSPEQRRAAALLGDALSDGSHVIRNADDLGESHIAWGRSGKPEGALKDHIAARAKALRLSPNLPPDFRADADKLSLAARLRKN